MPAFDPFPGVRYAAGDQMADLFCPPYDVISPEEQAALHERHPHNAVRLELARAGAGRDRYEEARQTFDGWLEEGVLVRDEPSFYVYRQDFTGPDGAPRRVVGVLGALGVESFGLDSGVLPHERTMAGPKADRLALLRTLRVNVSPIYSIYRGGGALAPFWDSLAARPPRVRFADESGVLHRMWVISAPAEIDILRRAIAPGPLVIADGHHRYETALEFHHAEGGARAEGGADGSGAIMCFAVDADAEELVVLPYNRVLRARAEADQSVLENTRRLNPGEESDALADPEIEHPFVLLTDAGRFLLKVSDAEVVAVVGDRAPAWRALDVVALHEVVLPRLFGQAIEELRFTKDPDEVARLVAEGWTAGVLLRAIAPARVVDVATTGERMPQKASYFWPKAATGLVFRSLR